MAGTLSVAIFPVTDAGSRGQPNRGRRGRHQAGLRIKMRGNAGEEKATDNLGECLSPCKACAIISDLI